MSASGARSIILNSLLAERKSHQKRLNIDELVEDAEDAEKSDAERSEVGSQPVDSDYDVDEEYDNDYAENYFDNGEGDDNDDLGGAAGGDEGGGGGEYKLQLDARLN